MPSARARSVRSRCTYTYVYRYIYTYARRAPKSSCCITKRNLARALLTFYTKDRTRESRAIAPLLCAWGSRGCSFWERGSSCCCGIALRFRALRFGAFEGARFFVRRSGGIVYMRFLSVEVEFCRGSVVGKFMVERKRRGRN